MEIFRANFTKNNNGKTQPISQGFSGQISLEMDQFCADLTTVLDCQKKILEPAGPQGFIFGQQNKTSILVTKKYTGI